MASHRQQSNGKWQSTYKDKFFQTLTGERAGWIISDSREQAEEKAERFEAMMRKGILPDEFKPENKAKRGGDRVSDQATGGEHARVRLLEIVNQYCIARRVSPSDDKIYSLLIKETGNPMLSEMTLQWAERLVASYKTEKVFMAPSTIRKRIGALTRAMDWFQRHAKVAHPVTFGKALGRGYSHYANGEKIDVARERFYAPGEEQLVIDFFSGAKKFSAYDTERLADLRNEVFERFYTCIRHTGMRLKEAYTLRVGQIDFEKNLLLVNGSKGHYGAVKPRHVPMKPIVRTALTEAIEGKKPNDLVFHYWDGIPENLPSASAYLSQAFTRMFKAAGVDEMREHDLRHVATIDWVSAKSKKTGTWLFQESELLQMMGWSNRAMLDRYIKGYRADDLASRLEDMAA